jgi:hypothetical protein
VNDFVVAECAIRQLHARFADIAWRKDAAGFAALFAENGVWKIAGMEMTGRAEIEATFGRLLGACAKVWCITGAPLVDVGQGVATSRTPVTEIARMMDGSSALTLGVYYDSYVEQGGAWYFQRRHFGLKYRGPTDLPADFVDSPDYGSPPGMPAADEPTFTRRKVD